MIWLPSEEDILLLHEKLIERTGGSHGVRDWGLVQSALACANAGFDDVALYPEVMDKAAAIGCGLAKNHGFIDGNKRIGISAMLLILRRNAIRLQYSQADLVALGLGIAEGRLDVKEVRAWLQGHIVAP